MMKKYSLLIVSLLWVSFSFGQILYEDFSSALTNENFSKIGWTNFAEEGTVVFQGKYSDTDDNTYVQMSASGSGETSNIAWLVTPSVYITPGYVLNFRSKSGFTNADALSLWISSNFSGDVSTATWAELSFSKPTDDGTSIGNWQASGVNLESYAGLNVCIAFKYTGGDPSATTIIQIDDIKISQDAKVWVNPATFIEEVEAGSVVNKTFTISNIGGGVLAWERSAKSFTKANHADWELEENQLWLTNEVSITRKNSQGLFNIAQETGYNYASPIGTLWSYGLSHEISMGDYQVWVEAINNNPPAQVGKDLSMHIIDTDIYFDIVFSSWTQGGNGGGFSLDYTLAQAPWITTSAQLGSIASGASQVVNVTFDASNLVAGEHHSQIQFYTNDPEAPIASIPVLLTVVGEPEINIAETAINFGDVFVNGNSTYELNIENTGTDVLNIASIVSDEATFEANLSSFIIEPSSAQKVIVSFNPTEVKEYTGTLTINSDDADESVVTIALSGKGIAAPEVSIDPTFFDVTITGCDVTDNQILTISNLGANNLTWAISDTLFFDSCENNSQGWTTMADEPDNLWHLSNKNSYSLNNSWWCGIKGGNNYDTGNTIKNGLVSPVIDLTGLSSAVLSFWENYITEGDEYDYCNIDVSINNGDSWIPIRNNSANGNSGGWVNSFFDLTPFCGEKVNIRFYFNTIDDIENDYPGWFIDDVLVAINPDSFLSFSKKSGVIGESGSDEISVTTISTGLDEGVYTNFFVVKTNDPLNSATIVPYELTVNTTPIIKLSKTSIDFLNVVTGEELNKTLVVRNTGCKTLEVTAITSSLAEFTTDAVTPFTLEPDESIEIVVTFAPADELVYEGTLTITNNDEEKIVTLSGEGVAEAPVITLSENSFAVTSDICDEVQTYPLTIYNTTGLANLNYEIVQDKDGEMVTLHTGSVSPAGDVIEDIEVDATGLNSGEYDYTLYVYSNDPANPSIAVSYTLTVNGVPDITVSPTSINFGDVLANDQGVEKFTITNDGCETLNVTEITSSLAEFTVDISTFSLLPGESIDVEVTFTPTTVESYVGLLTITNNDTEATINVSGNGIASATAQISPEFLDIDLEECDAIANETIEIANVGSATLNWEILQNKILNGSFETGDYSNWELNPDQNAEVVSTEAATGNYSVKITGGTGDAFNGLYQSFNPTTPDYVSVRIKGDMADPHAVFSFGDDNIESNQGVVFQYFVGSNININGLTLPYTPYEWYHFEYKNINYDTYTFDLYINGELIVPDMNFKSSSSYVSAVHLFNGFPANSYFDDIQVGGHPELLKLSNYNGAVTPEGSSSISVSVNALGLNSGLYTTNLTLQSNDPANPIIEIPVSVTVVGKPEILLSDDAFGFGEVIVDQSSTKTLSITNTGCKELTISNIISSETGFTVDNIAFIVLPNETVEVNVTFTPSGVLAYNATLTIVNDDAEQVIALSGNGIGAPEITVDPTTISATATSCNDQIAETLSIGNDGVSNLNWEVDQVAGKPSWVTMVSYAGTISASESAQVELLFDATGLASGLHSSNIVIESNDPSNPSVSIPVSLTVDGAPVIDVSPLALDFGQVSDGDSYQIDIEISNNGCADLEVTNIESDNAIFTVSGTAYTVTPGNSVVVTVTYSPVAEGEHTGTLTITSNDTEQTVALVGEALAAGTPIVQVLTTELNFGDVYLGNVSGVQQYTVSGTNLTESIVINVPYGFQISTMSGSGFGNSITLPQVGGNVGQTTIYVRFAPTARKAYSEQISHVSTGATQKNITITGNGIVPPNIYTSVQEITFNDVYVNYQSAEQSYNISASGLTSALTITAPTGFVISKTSGNGFSSTLTYAPADGIVPTSSVFVKFAPSTINTFSGNIEHSSTGATSKQVEVSGTSLDTYTVTFNVSDGTAPITGAEVTLAGYGAITSSATGIATFTDVVPESAIAYTVTADGYNNATGSVTVVNTNVTESVTMVLTTYTVSFVVKSQSEEPVEGAEIVINETNNLTTDASGTTTIELINGNYSFTVTKDGYEEYADDFTVASQGVAIAVALTVNTTGIESELLSTVKAYPNPFTTSITIENASAVKYIIINNLIGQKVMEIQLNGLNTETIATDKLTSGVYLVTFKNDSGVVEVKKMVKQ